MKIIASVLVLWLMTFNNTNAQTNNIPNSAQNSTVYFAQCMLTIDSEDELRDLEMHLRANPYIAIARVDIPTKRIFLLTKNIDSFSDETFTSWLGQATTKSYCHQSGIYGVDTIATYPFKNCK